MIGQPVADSVFASGTATAPAAGAAIATLAGSNMTGICSCQCTVEYGATAGAVDDFQIQAGATVLAQIRIPAINNSPTPRTVDFVHSFDGLTALSVNAVVGGVPASVYKAVIVVTQIRGG